MGDMDLHVTGGTDQRQLVAGNGRPGRTDAFDPKVSGDPGCGTEQRQDATECTGPETDRRHRYAPANTPSDE
jgi:hypothetical protein